ncbi:MAG: flagella basal body P-ring formation protein FlgA [Sphingomonas sp.]
MLRPLIVSALSLAIMVPPSAAAQSGYAARFQDTTALDRAVLAFAGRPIGVEGGARTNVDDRLKLAACPTLALSWRTEAHDAVMVTCTGPEWRIYVPMIMPAALAAPTPPLIAAAPPAPKPVIVIKRGDPVTIEASAPGFSVTRDGVAMTDAPVGGRFLVDVNGAKKPVQAVAVSSGIATLPGWGE